MAPILLVAGLREKQECSVKPLLSMQSRNCFSSKAATPTARRPVSSAGSRLAFLMHFLRFLAFALPLNFFLQLLIAAAR